MPTSSRTRPMIWPRPNSSRCTWLFDGRVTVRAGRRWSCLKCAAPVAHRCSRVLVRISNASERGFLPGMVASWLFYAFGDRGRIGRSADESGHYSRRFNYAAFEDKGQEGSAGHFEPGHKQFRDRILLAHRGSRLNPSALPKRKRSIVHRHRRMIHSNTNRAAECSRKSWEDGSIASYRRRATALAVCASLSSPCRSNGIARRT